MQVRRVAVTPSAQDKLTRNVVRVEIPFLAAVQSHVVHEHRDEEGKDAHSADLLTVLATFTAILSAI